MVYFITFYINGRSNTITNFMTNKTIIYIFAPMTLGSF